VNIPKNSPLRNYYTIEELLELQQSKGAEWLKIHESSLKRGEIPPEDAPPQFFKEAVIISLLLKGEMTIVTELSHEHSKENSWTGGPTNFYQRRGAYVLVKFYDRDIIWRRCEPFQEGKHSTHTALYDRVNLEDYAYSIRGVDNRRTQKY
jgi:hypothetical protein